jgi:D-alanyl-D-alanine carboxypeptidase/D-alanyl-D-alanine-endopeptidase (penicillin-binding protein 4)
MPGPSLLPRALRRLLAGAALALAAAPAALGAEPGLPTEVRAALKRAGLPSDALVAWVAELGPAGSATPRLRHRATEPVNPASLMKLYTTGAALELLGPAWTWSTPVLATGPVEDGVLHGDLVLQGRGDPTLVIERLWLLLRQLQQRGVREVRGDIVLDGAAFSPAAQAAGDFDGEPLKPYNVQPDALMLNQKTLLLAFVPEPARRVARVSADVALAGVRIEETVPLVAGAGCGDWRGALRADFSDPTRLRFGGAYPVQCGERSWPIAYPEPDSFNARLVGALWKELGGQLGGQVRGGATPPAARPLFAFASPPLAEVVRDINKYSNNVMAQQLFLSLALWPAAAAPAPVGEPEAAPEEALAGAAAAPPSGPATPEAARALLGALLRERIGCAGPELVIDNGSGLSRASRSSARCLGTWLQALWAGPVMPELVGSLPVTGVDGTTRRPGRAWGAALGRAHLKTGSLRDVAGIAGYVLSASGRRYVLVAILSHPDAGAGRPVLDALVQWTARDGAP